MPRVSYRQLVIHCCSTSEGRQLPSVFTSFFVSNTGLLLASGAHVQHTYLLHKRRENTLFFKYYDQNHLPP